MDDAKQEALIATLKARISSSYLNSSGQAKEPFDGPIEMVPAAYAMFEFLATASHATGHDENQWWDFLQEALAECIHRAELAPKD